MGDKKEALKILYKDTRIPGLLELCSDCSHNYCFFRESLAESGGANVRNTVEQFDSRLCGYLETVMFRTPLTDEQLFRRKLLSDLKYKLGLDLNRSPNKDEIYAIWDEKYEPKFKEAYLDGVRGLEELRVEVFG